MKYYIPILITMLALATTLLIQKAYKYGKLSEQTTLQQKIIEQQKDIINKQVEAASHKALLTKKDDKIKNEIKDLNTFSKRKELFDSLIKKINCNIENFESNNVC